MSMDKIEEKIENVEKDIEMVVKDIEDITKRLENETNEEKKKELREEKKELREREKRLGERERQLREEKLLLLGKDDEVSSHSAMSGLPQKRTKLDQELLYDISQAMQDNLTYWKKLCHASLVDSTMWIPDVPVHNKVYIRQAYIDIYEKYVQQFKHTLVLGSPGVGKTMFMRYVAYRLLQERPHFTIVVGESKIGNVFCIKAKDANYVTIDSVRGEYYYLFDCGQASTSPSIVSTDLCAVAKKTVVFSSPDDNNYKAYVKDYINASGTDFQTVTVCMPPWSWDEIACCREQVYESFSEETVKNRFRLWGGIARRVFSSQFSSDDSKGLLSMAISRAPENILIDIARRQCLSSDAHHSLLHMVPKENDNYMYSDSMIDFASTYVALKLYDKALRESANTITETMALCANEASLRGVYGRIFEAYCHSWLCSGKLNEEKIKSLEQTQVSRPNFPRHRMASNLFSHFDDVNCDSEQYYIPTAKNFASVDSIFTPDVAFQMTVNKDHGVKVDGLNKVQNKLGCRVLNLCFVVPMNILDEFRKQTYYQKNKVYHGSPPVVQWAIGVDTSMSAELLEIEREQ